jgi:hypothetical protein
VEPYGEIYNSSSGFSVPIFTVKIGEPQFDPNKWKIASIVGAKLANGKLFVCCDEEVWTVVEWREPTHEDLKNPDFPRNLKVVRRIATGDLPLWVQELNPPLRGNIRSFIEFYSGAVQIYLIEQDEKSARLLREMLLHNNAVIKKVALPPKN